MLKNVVLSILIDALLVFVLLYAANYRVHVYEVLKNILFGLGCMSMFGLVYKMVACPWGKDKVTSLTLREEDTDAART